ncbi:hypothetical protein SAMN04487926_12259 [Paraburkholderia steynii]|uniref:Uncharacterized protein n=1 Tax=Paraburkholderia steynii TaxID=1245441 RepID=A0A7Z7FJZ0_9BURK|nr:hypothetical protein [Paraburkholderia steynii]SDI70665.1 hypothetical protein SAMN04487926_12259 [Paraburkholderia steynii]
MLNIADDGTSISWFDAVSGRGWTARTPSLSEWQIHFHGNQTEESLARGQFMWVNGLSDEEVTVVFSPYRGLDFNLIYSILSGKLLKIEEAR